MDSTALHAEGGFQSTPARGDAAMTERAGRIGQTAFSNDFATDPGIRNIRPDDHLAIFTTRINSGTVAIGSSERRASRPAPIRRWSDNTCALPGARPNRGAKARCCGSIGNMGNGRRA